MDAIDNILSRRSIRRFTKEPVAKEDIVTMLKCACAAPSAMNNQPWHFLVISKREKLDNIARFHPHAAMMKEAQAAIAVLFKEPGNASKIYVQQDCAACTQNILLAAHALGYGAVWLGVFPRQERLLEARQYLGLDDKFQTFALIALGKPDEKKRPRDDYSDKRVHWNTLK
jgi:nitroreductase